jgi:hypothetical protein
MSGLIADRHLGVLQTLVTDITQADLEVVVLVSGEGE